MITVHHLNNSRSQRILWLLEELALPYEIKRYERDPKTMLAPPELLKIHPLGKSPVIDDDGVVVAETGAIIDYVLHRYGEGRLIPPPDTPERLRYTYWLHAAEGSAMPFLLLKLVFQTMPKRAPGLLRPLVKAISAGAQSGFIDPQLQRQMDYWEQTLASSPWFAGAEFTAADIIMSFPVEASAAGAGLKAGHPRCAAWLKTIHARPAYQRALGRGGHYVYAD
jgi:glutathione S-transferase